MLYLPWQTRLRLLTTGGDMRTKECPRYTQVGNAVTPHLAMMIGRAIVAALEGRIDGTIRPPLGFSLE